MPTTSYTGFNYSVIFTDDYTNYRWIQHSKKKSEIYDILLQQFEYYKNQYNQYPKKIRIDNGTEFRTNSDLPIFLKNKGIILELSTAYTPEQNGIAERSNRTIFDKARSIIQAYKIPIYLWEFILNSTVELINKTANKRLGITPYQALYDYLQPDKKPNLPDLNNQPIIGSTVYTNIPKELQQKSAKFDVKNEKGILVGYTTNKIYIIYIPTRPLKNRIIRTSHLEIINNLPNNNNQILETGEYNEDIQLIPISINNQNTIETNTI